MRKKLKILLVLSLLTVVCTIIIAVLTRCQSATGRSARCAFPTIKHRSRSPVYPSISFPPSPFPLQTTDYRLQTVSFVHDGDTIYTREFKAGVRLIGIDAPEVAGSYRCGKDAKCDETVHECGAQAAKEKLKEFVLEKEVYLVKDELTKDKDVYGRFLRYIFICADKPPTFATASAGEPGLSKIAQPRDKGTTRRSSPTTDYRLQTTDSCFDVGLELIQQGLVREAGFGEKYEKSEEYRQAQIQAKKENLGIWRECE